jgi:uncharacterized protein (TIGR02646 family)
MKWIEKDLNNEPKSLRLHRQKSFSNYDNYVEKDELRLKLLEEQGYICCYCMSRIQTPTQDKMKIEHWQSQAEFSDLQLNYKNLLASCRGNEGSDSKDFHCDKRKSDEKLTFNPMDKIMVEQLIFGRFGNIFIKNDGLQNDLDNVLNLNADSLKIQRESIYKGVTLFLKKEFGGKPPSKAVLNRALKQWNEKNNGQYKPFCQVAIYFLTKSLARAI